MSDARLGLHDQEAITAGAAVAGRIRNGWGCSERPLTCTPPFFANNPRDLFVHEGGRAARCTRCQRGRPLDDASDDGCDRWWSALARSVCLQAYRETRFNHLDTTSFSLPGDSGPDRDAHAMALTHGDAKDPRPALQQAVFERMVSQDGGVPVRSQSWAGPASDTQRFQERAPGLRATWQGAPSPRSLGADAKRSNAGHAAHRKPLGLSTRLPGTRQGVSQVIAQALQGETWQRLETTPRSQRLAFGHDGMAQRGLVVGSQASLERAAARGKPTAPREAAAIHKHLFPWQATRVETAAQAQAALAVLAHTWGDHQGESSELIDHQGAAQKGRPRPEPPLKALAWPRQAPGRLEAERLEEAKPHHACVVLGTTIAAAQRSDAEGIVGSKGPAHAEGGCRWRKDPLVFVASVLVKKPCRLQGLVMVMTLALLVSAVAQRRLRQAWARQNATIPHHIPQPTSRPTLRWVLHVWAGSARVRLMVDGQRRDLLTGLTEVKIKILRLFGEQVCHVSPLTSG